MIVHNRSVRRAFRQAFALITMLQMSIWAHASVVGPAVSVANGYAPELVTDWNSTFVSNGGPSGTIDEFVVWDDGSGEALYAGGGFNSSSGAFNTAGGIATHWIGRWNGIGWSALGSGLNGPVTAMVVFGGELIVSGLFTVAGGVPITTGSK